VGKKSEKGDENRKKSSGALFPSGSDYASTRGDRERKASNESGEGDDRDPGGG
jgi:hypothetical protein